MSIARDIQNQKYNIISVIGDGGMTAGMSFEAMCHAGYIKKDVLVVLNDNEMSISPNVGALNKYLTRMLTAIKKKGDKLLDEKNPIKKIARAIKDNTQNILTPGHLFEEIGFSYFGPIDGHDMRSLNETLESLKHKKGPLLLHVITKKGKGYKIAEKNPVKYHGVTPFDIATGAADKPKLKNTLTYTNIFTKWINHTAQYDDDFVAIL